MDKKRELHQMEDRMTTKNVRGNSFEIYQDFIVAEFEYISQTAFQAQENRARVSEFFLISFGTLLAALFTSQLQNVDTKLIYRLFSILFVVVPFLGALTVLQLCRLRQAWLESIRAMNDMKDYIIKISPELRPCFKWTSKTIPAAYKPWSVGFLLTLQVSVMSGIASGSAWAFNVLSSGNRVMPWAIVITIAITTTLLFNYFLYYLPLSRTHR